MTFFEKLEQEIESKKSLLCVGIDPPADKIDKYNPFMSLVEYSQRIIDETEKYAVCYKPNSAFFEAFGMEGFKALKFIIENVPGNIPVLLDAKRNDIGNTAKAYVSSAFDTFKADAITLNPYLGKESVDPFIERKEKGLFLLCRTSNPGARKLQTIKVYDEQGVNPYYVRLAKEILSWGSNVGLVVAGNDYQALRTIRELYPQVWLLAPGIGAQGGEVTEALQAGARADGKGLLLNVSRAIADAASPSQAARQLQIQIAESLLSLSQSRRQYPAGTIKAPQKNPDPDLTKITDRQVSPEARDLITRLIQAGCFKLGQFKLKSGKMSPFYIDLRLLISYPDLMSRACAAYASLLKPLTYDRLAGIPVAALPIAAVTSVLIEKPMIFPRLEVKEHGTGKRVEGLFQPKEQIALLDDLISTGKSKFEAIDVLKEAGLEVKDLVVLIERGLNCREELAEGGVRLHAYLHIYDFLKVSLDTGALDPVALKEILTFLNND